jgi:branched-chain amino acid transport system substrate-binding protein
MPSCCDRLLAVFILLVALTSAARADVLIGLSVPLTGPMGWSGAGQQVGAESAVEDLNAKGGVLGQRLEIIAVDDFCDRDQGLAAARKLVDDGVVAVFGPPCSDAAIPASKVYAEAGVLMISHAASNPKLTEQGFRTVFRLFGRDDVQGRMGGDLLANRFGAKPIAILHDGRVFGQGLAEEAKRQLNHRGITEAMFEAIQFGQVDYSDVIQKMQAMGIEVLYYGGLRHEAGLIVRQAHDSGYNLQLVAGDTMGAEDFALIAGAAADGTLFTAAPVPMTDPEAARLAKRFDSSGFAGLSGPFRAYAVIQVWAQGVERAGTFKAAAVAETLRASQFDTVLGRVGFDPKGDVTGANTFIWYVWKDRKPVPLEEAPKND